MTSATRRPRVIYANPSRAARPKPEASGRERFWWYFMRLSGLALVLLALGHMFIMHVLVELTGQEVNFAFVQSRWGTPFWRIYDLALLVLAFVHGANGARVVIGDLDPTTLAIMHGPSFQGDGRRALYDLAAEYDKLIANV